MLLDFPRFFLQEQSFKISNSISEVVDLRSPQLSPKSIKKIEGMISSFNVTVKSNGSDLSDNGRQSEQNGELQSVASGNEELTLKAVGLDQEKFALIQHRNIKSNLSQVIRYDDEALVMGYQLQVVSNTAVLLTKTNQKIKLLMYKRK